MAETRLSKLQKWILKTAHEREDKSISKVIIYEEFFRHPGYYKRVYKPVDENKEWYRKRNSHRVVLSRSLKTLERRGLVKVVYTKWWIDLTEAGKEKALMLISSTKKVLTIRKKESLNVNISSRRDINIKKNKQRR